MVDASVVAKWFNRGEENEEEAAALRKAWLDGRLELFAPSSLLFEVANSIWKNSNVTTRSARSLVKLAVVLSPRLVNLEEEAAEQAMILARKRRFGFYDTAFLALAKSLSVPFITADQEQLRAADGYVRAVHLSKAGVLTGRSYARAEVSSHPNRNTLNHDQDLLHLPASPSPTCF